ncbi:hypothetical protein AB4090_03925 [Acidithiobacillus sp. IBUN Pt1247-S3]|uniref:hypothetical protein n=1 Tax=Acidithiobacillus sp. IBUN Pt1247-S3 TaxID=3166642 RepID=UPI0034E56E06
MRLAMDAADRWVAGVLAAGVGIILLAILLVALFTRLPVSHLYVDASGARLLRQAGISAQTAPDWPGAYRVNAEASNAAFTSTAKLFLSSNKTVNLPRRDVLLWVYRG